MTQDATAQAAQAAGLQVTEHRPSRSNSEVDLNLVGDQAPICPFCTRGRVFLTGRKDWRSTILAYCDNPECGDLDDTEGGRHIWVRIFPDGTFNRFVPDGEVLPALVKKAQDAGLTKKTGLP